MTGGNALALPLHFTKVRLRWLRSACSTSDYFKLFDDAWHTSTLGFSLAAFVIEPVDMQTLGNQRDRDRADANEAPFLFRVLDQLADDKR